MKLTKQILHTIIKEELANTANSSRQKEIDKLLNKKIIKIDTRSGRTAIPARNNAILLVGYLLSKRVPGIIKSWDDYGMLIRKTPVGYKCIISIDRSEGDRYIGYSIKNNKDLPDIFKDVIPEIEIATKKLDIKKYKIALNQWGGDRGGEGQPALVVTVEFDNNSDVAYIFNGV
jgi:hypothetical protein